MHRPSPRLFASMLMFCLAPLIALGQSAYMNFDDFLARHSTAILPSEKETVLNTFWKYAQTKGIPFIDSNKTNVTFLFRGKADSVKLVGDFTSWAFKLRMRRLEETDLFFLRLSFESDARLDYKLVVNDNEVLDPSNKAIAPSGYGDHSELSMPDFVPAEELREPPNVPKGNLATLSHASRILGYERTLRVYTPSGKDLSRTPMPVIFFQDGADYVNFATATRILDNMIATKSIPPIIAVFIVPPTEKTRNRITEYAMNEKYASYLATELLPFIDARFPTTRKAADRLVVGPSFGGLASLHTAFLFPDSFAHVASQSGFVSFNDDSLLTLIEGQERKRLRVYLDVGIYERNIGGIARSSAGDFLSGNRRLSRYLYLRNYDLVYREFHDGHSWGRWRNELPNILRWFASRKK